ncbi:MAG: Hsp33 family molecular chaperone HslO, partial [Clostridia bacterium]|nr:Hsp33 family molecular chaperone HslO [Clostridia bacterium]
VSEQQPCAVALGVKLENDKVISAGGVILQPLPGCSEEVLQFLESSVPLITDVSSLFEGNTADEVGQILFYPVQHSLEGTLDVKYNCDCSRERLEKLLITLGKDELQDMIDKQGGAELTCHFCNKKYWFSADDLRQLMQ